MDDIEAPFNNNLNVKVTLNLNYENQKLVKINTNITLMNLKRRSIVSIGL
jgi:hypothetical protein